MENSDVGGNQCAAQAVALHYGRIAKSRVPPMTNAAGQRLSEYVRRKALGDLTQPRSPDADLLGRVAIDRDEDAFETIVRRHGSAVRAACRRVLGPTPDADDAFQATFVVFWREATRVRKSGSVGAWLYGTAHRIACQARIAAARRRRLEQHAAAATPIGMEPTDPSWREACGVLHEELDRLPDRFRLPLVLCYLESKSRDEAAAQLGWSVGSVKGRLERGRDRLRRRLMRRGIDLSAGLLAALASEGRAGVPTALIRATVESAGGVPSAAVAALVHGAGVVTHAKLVVVAVVLSMLVAGAGVEYWTGHAPADKPAQVDAPKPQAPAAPAEETITASGRVLDPDGKPVAGARLYTFRARAGKPPTDENIEAVARGLSDVDGRFRFDASKAELGTTAAGEPMPVLAAADGLGINWVPCGKPGDELVLRLVKDQPITGRILDTEGRPVADAQVRVFTLYASQDESLDGFLTGWKATSKEAIWRHLDKRTNGPPQVVKVSRTDREGRFRISGAGINRLLELRVQGQNVAQSSVFVVTRTGFDPKPFNQAAASSMLMAPRGPGDLIQLYGPTFDYVATPGKKMSGIVHDAAGKPVAGARVMAIRAMNNVVSTSTDADGRFSLAGIPKQPLHGLHVMPEKNSPLLSRSVEVPDTNGLTPVTADILLARGIIVTGQVIDKQTGKGVQSGIRFAPLPENQFFGKPGYDSYKHERLMSTTDADGRYRLTIIPGAGVVMAQAQTGGLLDGQYVNPYMLAAFDDEDRKHVKVSAEGSFSGADNSYETLTCEHAVKRLDLAEDAGPVTLNLYVHRGRTGKLTIQDAEGQPLPGAIVAGVTLYSPYTYTLKSAECPVYALDPKKPRAVVIYHAERKLGGHVVMGGDEAEPMVAKLQPLGTVTGRILDADGQPIAGATVAAQFSSDSANSLEIFLRQQRPPVRTDAAGRFRLDGIVPGQKLRLSPRKDRAFLVPKPQPDWREVAAGAVLDLGDVRTEPIKIGP
jgi:RNA polymerase sigma factor (sigma-70 family)